MNVDRPESDGAWERALRSIARLGAAAALLACASVARAANVDLTVTALTGAPASARVGQTFTVTDTTKTTGAVSKAFATSFYLSTDTVIATTDTLVGSRSIASLPSNGSSTATTTLTVPVSLAPGTYWLGAYADSGNVVTETNESNNGKLGPQITVVGADLSVTALTGVPAAAPVGGNFTVQDTVAASSTGGTAGPFTVGFYLSPDASVTTADVLLGSRSVSTLQPGASSAGSTIVGIPSGTKPGVYWVGAIADSGGAVQESDETNNTRVAGQVRAGPDLAVTSVTSTSSVVGAGDAFTVTSTVAAAAGGGPAGAFRVGIYLSADAAITTSDTLLGTYPVSGLADGQASTASTAVTAPAWLAPGSYWLGAIADDLAAVAEVDEGNNAAAGPAVTVGAFSCDHPATPIDDGNPCTTDACDPLTGVSHTPVPAGSLACDDGDPCTYGDACDGSGRCGGTRVGCVTQGPCQALLCDGTPACSVALRPPGSACGAADSCGAVCDGVSPYCQPAE